MKILSWIITLPIAIACIALAVANRHLVRLNLDPLPFFFEARLATVVLASFLGGVFFGMIFSKIRSVRRPGKVSRRQAKRLAKAATRTADEGAKRNGAPPIVTS